MWEGLISWCTSQQVPVSLFSMTSADLDGFIAHRCAVRQRKDKTSTGLSERHVWRLIHLVSRVLAFAAKRGRPNNR
ncbi:hypothetical protein, partial [Staphylococcus aureus]